MEPQSRRRGASGGAIAPIEVQPAHLSQSVRHPARNGQPSWCTAGRIAYLMDEGLKLTSQAQCVWTCIVPNNLRCIEVGQGCCWLEGSPWPRTSFSICSQVQPDISGMWLAPAVLLWAAAAAACGLLGPSLLQPGLWQSAQGWLKVWLLQLHQQDSCGAACRDGAGQGCLSVGPAEIL